MEVRSPDHTWLWKWLFAATRATTSRVGAQHPDADGSEILHRAEPGDEGQCGSCGLPHDGDGLHAGLRRTGESGQPGSRDPEYQGDGHCCEEHVGTVADSPPREGGEDGEGDRENDSDVHGGPCLPRSVRRLLPCGEAMPNVMPLQRHPGR
jgi:hypothetical protein